MLYDSSAHIFKPHNFFLFLLKLKRCLFGISYGGILLKKPSDNSE